MLELCELLVTCHQQGASESVLISIDDNVNPIPCTSVIFWLPHSTTSKMHTIFMVTKGVKEYLVTRIIVKVRIWEQDQNSYILDSNPDIQKSAIHYTCSCWSLSSQGYHLDECLACALQEVSNGTTSHFNEWLIRILGSCQTLCNNISVMPHERSNLY